ncbi:MAG: MaoC family dehydratase [Desulfitobacteriaceae bacterium]
MKKELTTYEVGEAIPSLVWLPTDMQLRQYAEASGDYNPIHLDARYAKEAGLGGVIAHGMLTMAQVGAMLSAWVQGEGTISQFEVRFQSMVRPEDTILCKGRIKEKLTNAFVCELQAINQNDQEVVAGKAVVKFNN